MQNNVDFSKLQADPSTYEINSNRKKLVDPRNSRFKNYVEVFSAILDGKSTDRFERMNKGITDRTVNHFNEICERAANDDIKAQAEYNAIREKVITTGINNSLPQLAAMGNFQQVARNEELKFKVYSLTGERSREQAANGAFVNPKSVLRKETMTTRNITGGVIENYQESAADSVMNMAVVRDEVVKDMTNQMIVKCQATLTAGILAAVSAGEMVNRAATINTTNVDAVLKLARRWGKVSITGDYDAVSQLNDMAKFATTATTYQWPEDVMNQILKNGLIGFYGGAMVSAMPNPYDLSTLDTTAGTASPNGYYDTMLPTDELFFTPAGSMSPLQIGVKGGITSMTAPILNEGKIGTRYDLQFATAIIPEYIPRQGYIGA